ncbi:MAG TPA: SusD/RagB family nutrient-binding outer membrane lipoprotein [Gemmatimonadaceae bacterium]|nr:SusD/RagB family nutrient-binding outer membrane lipoprotein [Gemmatimonadaceae bacterium]
MNRKLRLAVCAGLSLLGAVGCNDFLTGGETEKDPNRVLKANRDLLFVAVQPALWRLMTGEVARTTSMWVQQMEGTDRQYVLLNNYEIQEATFDGAFSNLYAQGGLIDLRQIQASADSVADSTYKGIAQVMEAMLMGTAADLWGDVPYDGILQGEPPQLTPQAQVYDEVQTLLDDAIANLSATGETNIGPGDRDLVYGGDPTLWIELAHTLKARFYLHEAETNPGNYDLALAEAEKGISDPSHDYTTFHSGKPGERNLWYQFMVEQRSGYISPNQSFGQLLASRNDPRESEYFTKNSKGVYTDLSATRGDATFPQPIVTWAENQLIWAEAAYRTGDQPTALQKLNEVKAWAGVPQVNLSGLALLREILIEKYIALFQNIEAWNDYKRTCFPNVAPAVTGGKIPGRLYYGVNERQTNPNIPPATSQPANNPNDPVNATDPFGNSCLAS